MPVITKARAAALEALETSFAAQGARLVALVEHLKLDNEVSRDAVVKLNQRIAALEQELLAVAEQNADARVIRDRSALLRRAKELNAAGVPCTMRGDYIIHARTKAILAQVQQ